MLDLSMFKNGTFDIKFSDEDILHVKKPNEDIAIKILAHVNIKSDKTTASEMLSATRDLTKIILNNNIDKRNFNDTFVKNLSLDIQIAIIKSYTEFMVKLEQNPN